MIVNARCDCSNGLKHAEKLPAPWVFSFKTMLASVQNHACFRAEHY